MKKIFVLIITLCETLFVYNQTCIIVRREKSRIIIAADTKVVVSNYSKIGLFEYKSSDGVDTFKKIGGYKNIYFAIAGADIYEMYNICNRICMNSKSIKEAGSKFIDTAGQRIVDVMNSLKLTNKNEYNTTYLNQKGFVQAAFCGIENDTTKIFFIKLGTSEMGAQILENNKIFSNYDFAEIPSKENPDNKVIALGHTEAIVDSVFLESTWRGDPGKTAIRLIKKQASFTPDIVGAPIDILIIKRKKSKTKRYN